MTLPAIGISLGDPGGVGPEIILKAFSGRASLPEARYIVFGGRSILEEAAEALGLRPDLTTWEDKELPSGPGLFFRDVGRPSDGLVKGKASAGNGEASFLFFKAAVETARAGLFQAVVTAPISKTSWRLAGLGWRGHTEYLESLFPGAIMTFWSEKLRVALLSHHLPLREALERVKKGTLLGFFRNLHQSLGRTKSGVREFLVAGLNPHAGEEGLLGTEEEEEIRPAVEEARKEGLSISGPFPPDTVFLKAFGRPDKMIIALYHDQGLIGFKLEAFETGVNATLGMPFIRTSPDHGTAYDIAGKGDADPRSLVAAIRMAVELS
jgi:4-hydroxythreonine-4-phosphate dehydrogenase